MRVTYRGKLWRGETLANFVHDHKFAKGLIRQFLFWIKISHETSRVNIQVEK